MKAILFYCLTTRRTPKQIASLIQPVSQKHLPTDIVISLSSISVQFQRLYPETDIFIQQFFEINFSEMKLRNNSQKEEKSKILTQTISLLSLQRNCTILVLPDCMGVPFSFCPIFLDNTFRHTLCVSQ